MNNNAVRLYTYSRIVIMSRTAENQTWLLYAQCSSRTPYKIQTIMPLPTADHAPEVLASTAPAAHARPWAMCAAEAHTPRSMSKTSDVLNIVRPARPPKT